MKLTTFIRFALAAGILSTQFPILGDDGANKRPDSIKDVIAEQEEQKGIPQDLLRAIAKIESGLSPWAINEGGRSHIFRTQAAAAQFVRELVDGGTTNFSVGCMQLHYASHRRDFESVEAMLDPKNNIAHAAKLIKSLERRYGSMERAIKLYHSASPSHHNPYKNRVYGMWAKIRGPLQPKGVMLKTVALQKETPLQTPTKTFRRSQKIKFGFSAASSKMSERQKT